MGIATVRGEFNEFAGSLQLDGDLTSASAHGTVKTASVDTNQDQRDEHLRSPDFFDASQYPEISFQSTSITASGDGDGALRITGDLTLHGVTKEIVLEAEIQGTETDPHTGNERVGLEVTGQLSRSDFGMSFNQALGSGNALVSDKIKLVLDVSAIKQA
jgi:polyisoprenoid-binding protein YceI